MFFGRSKTTILICSTLVLVTATSTLYLQFVGYGGNRQGAERSPVPKPLTNHVLSDLTVRQCTRLDLFFKCRTPPPGKGWIQIKKPLYLRSFWNRQAYIYARWIDIHSIGEQSGIIDIATGSPNKLNHSEDWQLVDYGIYIKRARLNDFAGSHVTAIDLLYGADAAEPRSGWSLTGPVQIDSKDTHHEPHITFRRGTEQPLPDIDGLSVKTDGTFKIMQISDLHLSTGVGNCMDPYPSPFTGECQADPKTFEFLDRVIADERPDLIVLSGDQLDGESSPDAQSAILKLAANLAKHKIPYASVFGNHDDEGDLSRSQMMSLLQDLPYSISRPGPSSIFGVGNYFLQVAGKHADSPALRIYLLDSGSYSTNPRYPGYDWVKQDQIEWFKQLTKVHRDQDHHGGHRSSALNLAFIHIPLPEYNQVSKQTMIGSKGESVSSPVFNSGFYTALVEAKIDAVSCGHDHLNDYSGTLDPSDSSQDSADKGPFLCYAGGAGFGGYGSPPEKYGRQGFVRRVRLFEVDSERRTLKTWKKLEWGDTDTRIDEQNITRKSR